MSTERFGSRFTFLVASIGMAVGAGNIWRFPRVAAEWGGGTFVIACILINLVWAVPLLMAESYMGSKSRLGTIGAFREFVGRRFAWMGGFMTLVTLGIAFYYSVICGWALRYFVHALTGAFGDPALDTQATWDSFTASPVQTIGFHLVAIALVGAIVARGLKGGFESVLKIALPALFVIMAILAVRAVMLPGAGEGVANMFAVDGADFLDVRVWLEAASQVAFSTGAGFGLYLTYSVYSRRNRNAVSNALTVAGGNFLVSLFAGVAVLGTLFALGSAAAADEAIAGGNQGLAFIYFARLFPEMTGGVAFSVLFFLALFMASVSTQIAFTELAARNLMDMGARRPVAVGAVVAVAAIGGVPSALNVDVLSNQDFVWGVGLLVSGLLIAVAMLKYGLGKARAELLGTGRSATGAWWTAAIGAAPVLLTVLLGFWVYLSVTEYAPDTWWNPFDPFSLATLLGQWAVALAIVLALNGFISRKTKAGPMSGAPEEDPDAAGAHAEAESDR
ncbi:sodium-dependent transporter [Nocardiopsis suaedae]|uniref:Sodium-dependent transporter n=1 Tax=Nocardiopsis suaedae TaxID=3018444 RepID=A0ABT4THJ8_9ACTN|nr:sodium-dependent transporter [Nocardiopsis suaedae]MDA2804183.1 sodium-dependent transporter [Nocardiopsis suaedae]